MADCTARQIRLFAHRTLCLATFGDTGNRAPLARRNNPVMLTLRPILKEILTQSPFEKISSTPRNVSVESGLNRM